MTDVTDPNWVAEWLREQGWIDTDDPNAAYVNTLGVTEGTFAFRLAGALERALADHDRRPVSDEEIDSATWALCDWDTDIADRGLSDEHWNERRSDVLRVVAALGLTSNDRRSDVE